jgi:hypothetical protein
MPVACRFRFATGPNSRSLGFAPTARRDRRDDRGLEGSAQGALGGKAHRRSLGYAPTASRGRRDDKGRAVTFVRRRQIGWRERNSGVAMTKFRWLAHRGVGYWDVGF